MLQLNNKTPFEAGITLFPDKDGIDTLYINMSARFRIGRQWVLLDEQIPPRAEDEYWGEDPATSSIKYASDYHLGKMATDIVMLGHAKSLDEKKVTQLDVGLKVGTAQKVIRVFGDRQWRDGAMTAPKPFTSMPMIYERAYGGSYQDEEGQILGAETRNLVGCGYLGKRKAQVLNDTPVPNLEDPRQLIQRAGDQVAPAGFGFVSPNWQPRVSYAGTYDEEWQTRRAPFLPKDFDPRFFNCAAPDLIYPGYIQGGEPVHLRGVHSEGDIQFTIPVIGITATVIFSKGEQNPPFRLETLLIEPDDFCLGMSWKAAVPCDKSALKIEEIVLSLSHHKQQAA